MHPYKDRDARGGCLWSDRELFSQVKRANDLGLQVNLLALGDRSVTEGLNIFSNLAIKSRRHTLEHVSYIQDADIKRMKEMKVIPIMNPNLIYPEPSVQQMLENKVGVQRRKDLYARWKDLMEQGIPLVTGSDFPLIPMEPILGMHLLVNATDINNEPQGGLFPEKCLTIEQALRTCTVNAAYAAERDHCSGMLRPGYDADCVMLSKDILSPDFDASALTKVKVSLTVMNGHVMYKDFSQKRKVYNIEKMSIELE